jgi:hypothetical protein
LYGLPGDAFPRNRAQATTEIARGPAVVDAAVHVTENSRRQHAVQEL